MKKISLKLLILILPFIVLVTIDSYILPNDYFAFRTWEVVSYNKFNNLKIGPFYPNTKINKTEEGDLGHHTKYALPKEVKWITDQYGYRNYEGKKHDTLILGDSNIAGSSIDQKNTFTEVLEDMIDDEVYSMGGAYINDYLADKRFIDNPPKRVIMASKNLPPNINIEIYTKNRIEQFFRETAVLQKIIKKIDEFLKFKIIRYTNNSIKRKVNTLFNADTVDDIGFISNGVLFLKSENNTSENTEARLKQALLVIKNHQNYFNSKGIEFIYLPIPTKKEIYHELIPHEQKSNFTPLLITTLQSQGIKVVNVYTAFEEAYKNGEDLYHLDDSHWNELAIRIAAQLTTDIINKNQ